MSTTNLTPADQLESQIEKIELILIRKSEALEKAIFCGSTKDTYQKIPRTRNAVSNVLERLDSALKRHSRAEEVLLQRIVDLENQLENKRLFLEEIQMERDVLLERVHVYLKANSSLKIRLEEQRCHTCHVSPSTQPRCRLDTKFCVPTSQEEYRNESKINTGYVFQNHIPGKKFSSIRRWKSEVILHSNSYSNNFHSENSFKRESSEPNTSVTSESLTSQISESQRRINLELALVQKKILEKTKELKKLETNTEEDIQENKENSVRVQLDGLKLGLANVSQKLDVLKSRVTTANDEDLKSNGFSTQRSLKRKAEPTEVDATTSERPKTDFKNLKDILEDAKNLNAKLQTLREEKEKIINSEHFGKTAKG